MYQAIKKHAPVVEKYAQSLIKEGTVTQAEYKVGRCVEFLFLLMHTTYVVGWSWLGQAHENKILYLKVGHLKASK